MKKLLNVIVCCLLLGPGVALAEITQAPNLSFIELAIKQADSDTLVIFDVDDVLITAKDQILKPVHKKYLEELNKNLESRHSEEEAQKLWSIIWLAMSDKVVDPHMIFLIKEAEAKGMKILALTNAWTGPFGKIPSLEDWRVTELESLGYSFKYSWSGVSAKTFEDLTSKDPKRFPVFKSGVLFTCNLQKGEVLKAFLQYADYSPKKIIFVDDKQKHLKSVEAFCQKEDIKFIGFEYTAVAKRPKSILNEKRAQYQFQILEKEHKWLSDEEVSGRLYNSDNLEK